mmetsp:Transcript_4292/g.9719  ORF Transcript_4292/g.9719 Transcript_4292/m.9719 type:complete len:208 (+) Transcript_4292:933-1556(+)
MGFWGNEEDTLILHEVPLTSVHNWGINPCSTVKLCGTTTSSCGSVCPCGGPVLHIIGIIIIGIFGISISIVGIIGVISIGITIFGVGSIIIFLIIGIIFSGITFLIIGIITSIGIISVSVIGIVIGIVGIIISIGIIGIIGSIMGVIFLTISKLCDIACMFCDISGGFCDIGGSFCDIVIVIIIWMFCSKKLNYFRFALLLGMENCQ